MHIAQYIEEQKRLNPDPKHWWQRTSLWYERIALLSIAIGGLVMAVYIPVRWVYTPIRITGDAWGLAFWIVVLMTVMSLIAMTLGALAAFRAFTSSPMPVSHLEAVIVFMGIVVLILAVYQPVHEQIERCLKLTEETKVLQAKIQMLEQQRLRKQ